MLLPQAWMRKRSLERALRGYPLYDPPHKVEERLLAGEGRWRKLNYFMRVREQRLAAFSSVAAPAISALTSRSMGRGCGGSIAGATNMPDFC